MSKCEKCEGFGRLTVPTGPDPINFNWVPCDCAAGEEWSEAQQRSWANEDKRLGGCPFCGSVGGHAPSCPNRNSCGEPLELTGIEVWIERFWRWWDRNKNRSGLYRRWRRWCAWVWYRQKEDGPELADLKTGEKEVKTQEVNSNR